MAIAFPNFAGVPVRNTDYSGIGDAVGNFYAGYNAPKDALIKAIQAKFAQPTAEQSLLSSQLSNRAKQLEIQKAISDMAQQKAFENQLKLALSSNGNATQPTNTTTPIPNGMGQAIGQALTSTNKPPVNAPNAPVTPMTAPSAPAGQTSAPVMPTPNMAQPTMEPNEIVITKGEPHLAGVDAMWNNNPRSRAFLEKQGYKKSQQIKFDNKTGRTSIITTYPSGKITMQTAGEGTSGEGIPLTSKMISKHQNIISSVDNALPIIKEIQDLNEQEAGKNGQLKDKYWEPYPRSEGAHWYTLGLGQIPGFQSKSTKYEALVNSVLDSLMGAYGLPLSNEGLQNVKNQILIGHGETDAAYTKRLIALVEDLKRRKSYSENQVKKSNTIQPIGRMGGDNAEQYSSDDWEQAQ